MLGGFETCLIPLLPGRPCVEPHTPPPNTKASFILGENYVTNKRSLYDLYDCKYLDCLNSCFDFQRKFPDFLKLLSKIAKIVEQAKIVYKGHMMSTQKIPY